MVHLAKIRFTKNLSFYVMRIQLNGRRSEWGQFFLQFQSAFFQLASVDRCSGYYLIKFSISLLRFN